MILIAIVEIPKDSTFKFEVNKGTGRMKVDRILNQKVPFNYGYIDGNNVCEDDDPIDVFIVGENPIPPLTEVYVELFGVLRCKDNGAQDDKLLARVLGDSVNGNFGVSLIQTYLRTYKPGFEVGEFEGPEEAEKAYKDSVALYLTRNTI